MPHMLSNPLSRRRGPLGAAAFLSVLVALTASPVFGDAPAPNQKSVGVDEPYVVGAIKPVQVSFLRERGPVQQHKIHHPDAAYLKIRFSELYLLEGETVTVSTPDRSEVYVYPPPAEPGPSPDLPGTDQPGEPPKDPRKQNRGAVWMMSVDGDTAILDFQLRDGDGLVGTIDGYAHGFPWIDEIEDEGAEKAVCGSKDYRRVKCYESSHPTEYARSRAVARLLIGGTRTCTGFRIGPSNHMLTNEHCLTNQGEVDGTEVWFNYRKNNCVGVFNGSKTKVDADDFLVDSEPLDFALFTIRGLTSVNGFGYLLPDLDPVAVDDEIYIPQHPSGSHKRLAIESDQNTGNVCRVDVPVTAGTDWPDSDMGYFCDTKPGSSGSPVLSRDSHGVVALHHLGGTCNADGPNKGVLMTEIWPLIEGFIPFVDGLEVAGYGASMWFEGSDYTNTPLSGDFNNDGLDDIAYRGFCGTGTECWRVHLNTGGGSFSSAGFGGVIWFAGDDAIHAPVVGDFDNDNWVDDIAYYGKCGGGSDCWRVHLSNGSSFSTTSFGASMWFKSSAPSSRPVAGDFDSDGHKDDIAYYGKCGTGTDCWRVHIGNISSFSVTSFGASMWFEGSDDTNTPVAGNFDGDMFADDIAYRGLCGSGTECWRVHRGQGSYFTVAGFGGSMWFEGSDPINAPMAANFDGVGPDDIGYFGFCGPGMLCWRMHLSNGSSFTATNYGGGQWFGGSTSPHAPVAGRFNDTGPKADVGYAGHCGSGTDCWRVHWH